MLFRSVACVWVSAPAGASVGAGSVPAASGSPSISICGVWEVFVGPWRSLVSSLRCDALSRTGVFLFCVSWPSYKSGLSIGCAWPPRKGGLKGAWTSLVRSLRLMFCGVVRLGVSVMQILDSFFRLSSPYTRVPLPRSGVLFMSGGKSVQGSYPNVYATQRAMVCSWIARARVFPVSDKHPRVVQCARFMFFVPYCTSVVMYVMSFVYAQRVWVMLQKSAKMSCLPARRGSVLRWGR